MKCKLYNTNLPYEDIRVETVNTIKKLSGIKNIKIIFQSIEIIKMLMVFLQNKF